LSINSLPNTGVASPSNDSCHNTNTVYTRAHSSDTGTKGHPSPSIGSRFFLAGVRCPGHKHTAPSRRRVTAPVYCWTSPLSEVLGPGGTALEIKYLMSCRQGPLYGDQIVQPAGRSICRPSGLNKTNGTQKTYKTKLFQCMCRVHWVGTAQPCRRPIHKHLTDTSQSLHSHLTVTSQSPHSHLTVTSW
jgi:hypothetical protein